MQPSTYAAIKALLQAEAPTAQQADFLRALLPGEAGEPPPQCLTSRQVSSMLHVCTRQVERWSNEGKLHPVRLGRRCVRYDAAEIRRLLARPPALAEIEAVTQ